MSKRRLIMMGPPGAGKGTQAKLLSSHLNIPQISTGDIFRIEVQKGSDFGMEAQSYMSKGFLVPDDLTISMVRKRLNQPDCSDGFILDGFPRTLHQAKAMQEYEISIDAVIFIDVADIVLVERVAGRRTCANCSRTYHMKFNPPDDDELCNVCKIPLIIRDDDKVETFRKRLLEYRNQTEPVVNYYLNRDSIDFFNVDGEEVREHIFDHILVLLGSGSRQ